MTVTELRPVSFSDSYGPIGWSISLVAVLLLHLAFAYYIFVYHRMEVAAPPPPPKAILLDLAPVAPLLGPKIAPLTQPVPLQPFSSLPSYRPPRRPSCRPRRRSILPWRHPRSRSRRRRFPTCRSCPKARFAPLPRPAEPPPPEQEARGKETGADEAGAAEADAEDEPEAEVAAGTAARCAQHRGDAEGQSHNPMAAGRDQAASALHALAGRRALLDRHRGTPGPDHHRSPGPCPEGLGGPGAPATNPSTRPPARSSSGR